MQYSYSSAFTPKPFEPDFEEELSEKLQLSIKEKKMTEQKCVTVTTCTLQYVLNLE